MSIQAIHHYHNQIHKIFQYSGANHEQAIKDEFKKLINVYCEKQNLLLVSEISEPIIDSNNNKRIEPDGIVFDWTQSKRGYWESKANVDLEKEITKKINTGYSLENIIFQDDKTAILYRNGQRFLTAELKQEHDLDKLLTEFVNYESKETKEFLAAIEQFKINLPEILEKLRNMIIEQQKNSKFVHARANFLEICQNSINPEVTIDGINEILIQHILTEEIFISVFSNSQFHQENNIARELYKLENTFFTGKTKRDTLESIKSYYAVIKNRAGTVSHKHRQQFLKAIYENFYKIYNPKIADKQGIVYTPDEIVKFQIESVDYLLQKHFKKTLADEGIKILDPCTGTGTYICDLIEYLPPHRLNYKYQHDIFANELGLLSYYIANLNIEYTYQQKMGGYEEFNNICWVDTLDNTGFGLKGTNMDLFGFSVENTERIKKQNSEKISVIIGNPPYNAKQENYNQQNANRLYKEIDSRIKETYIKHGTAQNQIVVYDMYTRFYRWASDRINEEQGVIAFITNNSFINSRAFDGFRKCITEEFDFIYIIDLGGNIRELSGKDGIFLNEEHTIFGVAAAVGIALIFLVKTKTKQLSKLYYIHPCDIRATRKEKLDYLKNHNFEKIDFDLIIPDKNNNWINQTDNDFDDLISLIDKDVKSGKGEQAIFKLFSRGLESNRQEWVYDFNKDELIKKINFITDSYNKQLNNNYLELDNSIKWSRELKRRLDEKIKIIFDEHKIVKSYLRPFIEQWLYLDKDLNSYVYSWIEFSKDNTNKSIGFISGISKPFSTLALNKVSDLNFLSPAAGGTQCLPLYVYDKDGKPHDNITDWALNQFNAYYKIPPNPPLKRGELINTVSPFEKEEAVNIVSPFEKGGLRGISKQDIFHYVYAVLHNPAYRKKYEQNLKREFPRIPFYNDFFQWAEYGKQLMELHINYETLEKYPLQRHDNATVKLPKAKLKADKENGLIILDDNTYLSGIPSEAWQYKLGNRSALEWILDQYKEKKPKDSTIAEKFNSYKFADYKEQVIDLLMRVCTVSIKTVDIVNALNTMNSHILNEG